MSSSSKGAQEVVLLKDTNYYIVLYCIVLSFKCLGLVPSGSRGMLCNDNCLSIVIPLYP